MARRSKRLTGIYVPVPPSKGSRLHAIIGLVAHYGLVIQAVLGFATPAGAFVAPDLGPWRRTRSVPAA
jgi:hypothetical protein